MALTLVDGLPGSGKTQYAIKQCMLLSSRSGSPRPVFYASGNDSLKFTPEGDALGWNKIDAARWMDCPDGSIILIDEVQFLWGVRPAGSKVPEHIAALATHRHRGFDFFVVTQDGTLIDQNVRKICAPYCHLERPFGAKASKVWTFPNFCQWQSPTDQKRAETSLLNMDKSVWGLYQSATIHTHKVKIPKRAFWIVPAVGAILLGGWFAIHLLLKMSDQQTAKKADTAKSAQKAVPPGAAAPVIGGGGIGSEKKKQTVQEWISDRRPRIAELPHTAPLYDDLARPLSFPLVSACVLRSSTKVCKCYSQQGTVMVVPVDFCEGYVKHGAYDHFLPDTAHGQQAARNGPLSQPRLVSGGPPVAAGGVPSIDRLIVRP